MSLFKPTARWDGHLAKDLLAGKRGSPNVGGQIFRLKDKHKRNFKAHLLH